MKLIRTTGKTSQTVYVEILDSTSTTGAGKTGLTFSGVTAYYVRTLAASVSISVITQTITGAYSSGGFVEVDATHMPGVYRFDLPNAILATGADSAVIVLQATGAVDCRLEIDLGAAGAFCDEVNTGATHNVNSSVGKQIRGIAPGTDAVIYPPSGTVNLTAASSSTATLDASASAVAQAYQWDVLNIITGLGAGQSRIISNYTTGRIATITPNWTTTPDTSSTFDITPTASVQVVSYVAGQTPLIGTQVLGAARALDAIADTALTVNDAMQCAVASITAQLDASSGTSCTWKTASTATLLRTKALTLISPPASVPSKAV